MKEACSALSRGIPPRLCLLALLASVSVWAAVKPREAAGGNVLPPIWAQASPRERLKALKVAQLDALRLLSERVYGSQLYAGTTVLDFTLASDTVRSGVEALLKGAEQTEDAEYLPNGTVQVVYGIDLKRILDVIESEAKAAGVAVPAQPKPVAGASFIDVMGNGALPRTQGMRRVRAKRAAEMDAYRRMAERLVGVRISAETTTAELCLGDDRILASVSAFLRGAKPTDIVYHQDDSAEVTMELNMETVVETIETITRRYQRGLRTTTERTREVNRDVIKEKIVVTGHGAPRDDIDSPPRAPSAAVDSSSVLQEEREVLRAVLSRSVRIE